MVLVVAGQEEERRLQGARKTRETRQAEYSTGIVKCWVLAGSFNFILFYFIESVRSFHTCDAAPLGPTAISCRVVVATLRGVGCRDVLNKINVWPATFLLPHLLNRRPRVKRARKGKHALYMRTLWRTRFLVRRGFAERCVFFETMQINQHSTSCTSILHV